MSKIQQGLEGLKIVNNADKMMEIIEVNRHASGRSVAPEQQNYFVIFEKGRIQKHGCRLGRNIQNFSLRNIYFTALNLALFYIYTHIQQLY